MVSENVPDNRYSCDDYRYSNLEELPSLKDLGLKKDEIE